MNKIITVIIDELFFLFFVDLWMHMVVLFENKFIETIFAYIIEFKYVFDCLGWRLVACYPVVLRVRKK